MPTLGSAIGFGYTGVMISAVGVERPDLIMKSLVPVVMASVISIYGLIVSLLVTRKGRLFFLFK
ncbi:hypothetical protein HZS_3896 [Henneguya salminicola]|nr:hypothetical protein HZS_3896 [Henneguya salminicola]